MRVDRGDLNGPGAPTGGKALVHDAADFPGRQPEIELGFARGRRWTTAPFRAILWLRLTHQREALASPAGVIYPPETPRPARTWPPAGVCLVGKVSPPAMLPGGRGPRCVAPAQRGPLGRRSWLPPLGATASFSLVPPGDTAAVPDLASTA